MHLHTLFLKEQVEEMRKKEERLEKQMNEVMTENRRLIEPLQKAKEEVQELQKQVGVVYTNSHYRIFPSRQTFIRCLFTSSHRWICLCFDNQCQYFGKVLVLWWVRLHQNLGKNIKFISDAITLN